MSFCIEDHKSCKTRNRTFRNGTSKCYYNAKLKCKHSSPAKCDPMIVRTTGFPLAPRPEVGQLAVASVFEAAEKAEMINKRDLTNANTEPKERIL